MCNLLEDCVEYQMAKMRNALDIDIFKNNAHKSYKIKLIEAFEYIQLVMF